MGQQLHMTMLEDVKRAAWARTSPVGGQSNAWEFRKDCLGNLVRYVSLAGYGNDPRVEPLDCRIRFRQLCGSRLTGGLQLFELGRRLPEFLRIGRSDGRRR